MYVQLQRLPVVLNVNSHTIYGVRASFVMSLRMLYTCNTRYTCTHVHLYTTNYNCVQVSVCGQLDVARKCTGYACMHVCLVQQLCIGCTSLYGLNRSACSHPDSQPRMPPPPGWETPQHTGLPMYRARGRVT